jgi:hypothetical protein
MLANSKIVLWGALMLGTASVATAATKHPIHHERTTMVQTLQTLGQTETSSRGGLSYAMRPAQRSAPQPAYDLFRDPAFIAPQGSR